MAIALVQAVGAGGVSVGEPVVTVPAGGCAAGNLLVAVYGTNGATALTTPAVSDSKANTWQDDRIHDDGTAALHVCVSSSLLTTALVSGDTITTTANGGGVQKTLEVFEFSGVATSGWRDVVNSALGTSTTPSSGNLVTTQTGDLLIGACAYNTGGVNYVPGATASGTPTELAEGAIGASSKQLERMYLVCGAAATETANGTLTSTAWVQVGVTYKAVAGPPWPDPTYHATETLMVVKSGYRNR